MATVEIVFGILLIFFSITLVLVVLFQEGKQQGLGAIAGGSGDTFLMKHKARTIDTFLESWTRTIAVGFFILVIFINAIAFFKLFQ